jgi:ArsR family transcriptional regulator
MSHTAIEMSAEQSARISKAIADPQRFAILNAIALVDELACKELVEQFPITQATISHHLKELVAAELIHSRRDGQMAILKCRRDVCENYLRSLAGQLLTPPSA